MTEVIARLCNSSMGVRLGTETGELIGNQISASVSSSESCLREGFDCRPAFCAMLAFLSIRRIFSSTQKFT